MLPISWLGLVGGVELLKKVASSSVKTDKLGMDVSTVIQRMRLTAY